LRILFIYPNIDAQIGFNYGIASLSAVLRKKGHETGLLNLNEALAPVPSDEELIEQVRAFNPDIVGFSCVTTQFKHAERIARKVKEELDLPTIAGGVHATMVPAEILRTAVFDFACLGEAEDALPELLDRMRTGGDTTNIHNIWAARDLSIYTNKVGPFPDISKLPRKDYSIFDFQRMIDAKDGWVGLMAGRGCPFKCTYCFNHQIVERYRHDTRLPAAKLKYIRHHPVEDVIAEMKYLLESYERIRMFIFDDDVFTLDKDYVLDFCRRYQEEHIGIPFVVNAHVKLFDEEIAKALSGAGCRIVKFGLESGSPRVRREVLRRYMSNDSIAEAFDVCRRHNLHSSAFLMIGLPTETREELLETVELLGRSLPGRFRWSVFYPFPGTEAHNIARKAGAIDEKKMAGLHNFFTESCLDFGEEHNLLLDKLNAVLPWYVNAASSLPCAGAYGKMIDRVAPLSREQWEKEKESFIGLDALMSRKALSKGMRHYAIKYNRFMGVDSDYFSREDA
jgi:anaerobic magnesium-protoporphyrin IX monomethyl ester cyclase